MSSSSFKKIKAHYNSKNKINVIKNLTGMNDPAFQSNKTLKEYINKKLNSYLDPKLSLIQKAKSFTKFNDKSNTKIIKNNPNNTSPKENLLSKSLNKKINMSNISTKKNNYQNIKNSSFLILKYIGNSNNFCSNKEKNKLTENSICINVNDNSNIIKYQLINNTPISMKQKGNKTTPINELNKKKCIYNAKQIYLNKSMGKENNNRKSSSKKNNKENYYIINQKFCKNITPKTPLYKNSVNQIKLLKEEIFNEINKNDFNIKIEQLNKSYFREESKLSKNNCSKILNHKINYSKHNKLDRGDIERKKKNRDKIKDLLNNDESFKPSQCPIPMPYVKRYSENLDMNSKIKENINFENLLLKKDLNEPKEEKKIPLPISQPINAYYFLGNNKRNKKHLVYANENKNQYKKII